MSSQRRMALWDISESCNLRCKFCYHLADGSPWSNLKTPLDDGVRIIERLAGWSVTDITFVGGEPLLSRNLPAFVREARSKHIACTVTTNGSHLKPERFTELVQSLRWLEVSIDSLRADYLTSIRRDVAPETLRAFLFWATRTAAAVRVIMTVTKNNLDDIPHVAALCREAGARELKLQAVYLADSITWRDELVLSVDQHDDFERRAREVLDWNQGLEDYFAHLADCSRERKKWTVCSAFRDFIYIDVRGNLRRCPSLPTVLTDENPFHDTPKVCEEMTLDCLSCFNLMEDVPYTLRR